MCLTVLGGSGFIGSRYVKRFYDPAVGNIRSINSRSDYTVRTKDVLNFVSTVTNYHVFDEPYRDIDTNLTTLISMLESWRKRDDAKNGTFNFISSWFVYGDTNWPHDVKEDAPCNPKGFYSITKRTAEQLLISYCETFGLRYRILRLANVIGPGDTKASPKKNALQYLVNRLKAGRSIEIYGDGSQLRDYIHVEDCVRAIELVVSSGEKNAIYNIGNGRNWPLAHIIRFAARELNSASPIKYIPPKEFHTRVQVPSFYLNVDKLRGLGFYPEYTDEKLFRSLW